MKYKVVIDGKKYRLSFWKMMAVENMRRIERLEKQLKTVEKLLANKVSDNTANTGD